MSIVTYKGTDKDMKCRGFQYELDKPAESAGAVRCGSVGLHSCEVPLDVLTYYGPGDNRYFRAEADGEVNKGGVDEDSKIASSKLTLKAEIGIPGLARAQVEWVKKTCQDSAGSSAQGYRGHAAAQGDSGHAAAQGNWGHAAAQGDSGHAAAQGDSGHAAAQGYRGHAAAQGNWGHAAAQGDRGHAEVKGKNAIAAAFGVNGTARGADLSDWIVLAEYDDDCNLVLVVTAKVDGERIKPDVWYTLKNGKITEVN